MKYPVTVKHRHMEPTGDGHGRISVSDPDTLEYVTIDVDLEAIAARCGPAACYNKSGRSKQLGGCVIIRKVSQ
jgi:hypothetical protein